MGTALDEVGGTSLEGHVSVAEAEDGHFHVEVCLPTSPLVRGPAEAVAEARKVLADVVSSQRPFERLH